METCITLLAGMLCMSGPPTTTAAEAAAILAPHQFEYAAPVEPVFHDMTGIAPYTPGSGPFGPFPEPPPRRRLDGTLLTTPPQILGLPFYHPYSMYRNYGVVLPQVAY